MKQLKETAKLQSGSPQFRIKESSHKDAPLYYFYGQQELESDLHGIVLREENPKSIKTADTVSTLKKGTLIFSLLSGTAAIVSALHNEYLFTQNFIEIIPNENFKPEFLAYLLNENQDIKRQLVIGMQGSATMKYTILQLSELEIPDAPPLIQQEAIGRLYFSQLKLEALKEKVAKEESRLVLSKIKELI